MLRRFQVSRDRQMMPRFFINRIRKLIHERMLPAKEERAFFQELDFPSDLKWLKTIYLCEVNQVDLSHLASSSAQCSEANLLSLTTPSNRYRPISMPYASTISRRTTTLLFALHSMNTFAIG